MSLIMTACMVCGETYTIGMVGTAQIGPGHVCPVKVQRDRYRAGLERVRGELIARCQFMRPEDVQEFDRLILRALSPELNQERADV